MTAIIATGIWKDFFRDKAAKRSCHGSMGPNESKMSDGGRNRASLAVNGWKSSEM